MIVKPNTNAYPRHGGSWWGRLRCWLFNHPLDYPLTRVPRDRVVVLFCGSCGVHLMTHVNIHWKPPSGAP